MTWSQILWEITTKTFRNGRNTSHRRLGGQVRGIIDYVQQEGANTVRMEELLLILLENTKQLTLTVVHDIFTMTRKQEYEILTVKIINAGRH
jgi:predicted ATP-dependent protease